MFNKYIVSIFILIVLLATGCTSKKPKLSNQFRKLANVPVDMPEEDAELNSCFNEAKISCYELYPYSDVSRRWGDTDSEHEDRAFKVRSHFDSCIIDHSVTCSELAGRDDLVQNLEYAKQSNEHSLNILASFDWFFLSPTKISKFIKFIKSIRETKKRISARTKQMMKTSKDVSIKMMHGRGVGVTASAFGVVGTSFTGEGIILDGHFSLFCAPGIQLVTDIGVEANFSAVRALSCENKNSYKGKFLTLQAGLSAEALGLPAGVHAAYSFGVDTHKLLSELVYYKKKNYLNTENLAAEYIVLKSILADELLKTNLTHKHQVSLWLAMKLGMMMSKVNSSNSVDDEIKKINISLEDVLQLKGASLSHFIKYAINTQTFQNILTNYKLRNTKIFFRALEKSLTGCDSISGGVSLSLSISPLNLGVQITHYEEIFSTDLNKLVSLRNLSSLMLMNPFLMDKEMIYTVTDLARLVDQFPNIVKDKCYIPAGVRAKETYDLINELSK